ncbi:MAG: hypothetical protein HY321_17715 [Armatimonadetes bacterium]|nr:hypothetical protein [Armatimonadota bacterium]
MARTSVKREGGREEAPDTITLVNDRLSATLRREGDTYLLSSLCAGGEYELLSAPSPLLFCDDGKEQRSVPLPRVAVAQEDAAGVRLHFPGGEGPLRFEVSLTLATGRPFLDLACTFQSERDWEGVVTLSCLPHKGFLPAAYPWIAGEVVTDRGFAHANAMGVPLLMGDPRRADDHVLALGFPLSECYRDLFFHYDPETRRVSAGCGEGRSRPGFVRPAGEAAADERRGWRRLLGRAEPPEAAAPPEGSRLSIPYRAGRTYRLPVQIWAVVGRYRNLAGEWMKATGFTFDYPTIRPPEEALAMTLEFLERGAPFIAGKGYPIRARRYERAPGSGDGGALHLYGNMALACALYRCWVRFRQDWMRERALAITDFVIGAQRRDGHIPELWDPRSDDFGTLGEGFHYDGAGFCTDALVRLYLERREAERVDDVRLRRAAGDALGLYLRVRKSRMDYERRRGKRRHDEEMSFPYSGADRTEAANVNILIVLERFRQLTEDRRYEIVREDAEKWLLHHVYHQMSWRDGDPLRRGLEVRSLVRAIEYCVMRYQATQGKRYQEMAEMLAPALFFALVPKDLEWCAGRTRGLLLANGEWRGLAAPLSDCVAPITALQRLGKLANDRFYAQLGDYLARVAPAAQCDERGVPGYGGWLPAVNAPDAHPFPLNGHACDGEVCVTSIVPAILEALLYVTR